MLFIEQRIEKPFLTLQAKILQVLVANNHFLEPVAQRCSMKTVFNKVI